MVNNKHTEREQARKLRAQGVSIITIAKELNVSKGSVSVWVRDIELTPEQAKALTKNKGLSAGHRIGSSTNRNKALEKRQEWQLIGRIKAREGCFSHMTGCMLYWAEGAKRRNSIVFVNSDPDMMLLFIHFLRQDLSVTDDMIKLQIHCHTNALDEKKRIGDYWLTILGLNQENLKNIQTIKSSKIGRNILSNGVCAISVHSTQLTMHIYGAIQEYGGFDRPEWLF